MTDFDKTEIIRDNRVTRLLWFTIGFICAVAVSYFIMKHQ
jgi:hypothetical protein